MAKVTTLPNGAALPGATHLLAVQDGRSVQVSDTQLLGGLQAQVTALVGAQPAGLVGFTSEAAMNAAVSYPPDTLAEVAGVGMFRKTGAAGVAGWTAFVSPTATAVAADRALAEAAVAAAAAHAGGPDYVFDRQSLDELFAGTGRTAVWVWGNGAPVFGRFGDAVTGMLSSLPIDRFSKLAGTPAIVLAKEDSAGLWHAVVYPWSEDADGGNNFRSAYCWVRPGKRARYDAATVTDGNGGAVGYPMTSAALWVEADLTSHGPVNFVGLTNGPGLNNAVCVKIDLTDTATSDPLAPNLVATAAQAVRRTQCLPGVLIANGGTLAEGDFILSGTGIDSKFILESGRDLPVWEGEPTLVKMRATYTPEKGRQQAAVAVDRFYFRGYAWCAEGMEFGQPGVEPIIVSTGLATNDSSTNDDGTGGGKPADVAGAAVLNFLGGHGHEKQTSLSLTLDGEPVYLLARSATFRRVAGVNRVVTATPHGIGTDPDVRVAFAGFPDLTAAAAVNPTGGSNRELAETDLTVIDPWTVEWDCQTKGTGLQATYDPDVAEAVYTAGWVKRSLVVVADEGEQIELKRTSQAFSALVPGVPIFERTQRDRITPCGLVMVDHLRILVRFNAQTGFYPKLESVGSGDRALLGPDYQGSDTRVRLLGGSSTFSFNAALVETNTDLGKIGGAIAWHAETGRATAVGFDRPSLDTSGFWGGNGRLIVQERVLVDAYAAPRTVGLKFYWRLTPTNKTYEVGDEIIVRDFRYDHRFDPARVDELLKVT